MEEEEVKKLFLNSVKKEQEAYDTAGLIYLRRYRDGYTSCLSSFISWFMEYYNEYYRTFYDKECTKTQCFPDCNRSAGDIYRICKAIFPDCTLLQVIETLYKLVEDKSIINMIVCGDLGKRVYFYDYDSTYTFSDPNKFYDGIDEFGLISSQYNPELFT